MADVSPLPDGLLDRAAAGDVAAWGALLSEHEARLVRMVEFRIDSRLRGRIDAADVVQEAFLEAAVHRTDFFRGSALPLYLWLRGLVGNKLLGLHRRHLGTRMRNAARDVALQGVATPHATSAALINQLTGHATRPSAAAMRGEQKQQLHDALDAIDPIDREVLALRHFEQLTNVEVASVLGIQERAAAKRYLRALKRLKTILANMPGGLTGMKP
jgi:RNA polymerase sigma-70 factor (ECF subfamily)